MHFLGVAWPSIVGSATGRVKWPNEPGSPLLAGVPMAGSVNALSVESGNACAPLVAALLEVAAGEPWDPFVARCVAEGLAGIECLSGIPGSVGATPIQNVGAYGQDVSETIARVRVYDRLAARVEELPREECSFTYRSSVFKRNPGRWIVLAVTFELARTL